MAILIAITLTSFMTAEMDVVLFGFAYLLPIGLIQKTAYILTAIASAMFFVWFTRHIYQIEMKAPQASSEETFRQ